MERLVCTHVRSRNADGVDPSVRGFVIAVAQCEWTRGRWSRNGLALFEHAADGPKKRLQKKGGYELEEEQVHWEMEAMFEKVFGRREAHSRSEQP